MWAVGWYAFCCCEEIIMIIVTCAFRFLLMDPLKLLTRYVIKSKWCQPKKRRKVEEEPPKPVVPSRVSSSAVASSVATVGAAIGAKGEVPPTTNQSGKVAPVAVPEKKLAA
jgi:hypothetical protein